MDKTQALIAKHEGLRLKPYRCTAGKLTIGYGRNLDDVGISEEEAEEMLRLDIWRAKTELRVHYDWFADLDEVRKSVVINMCFNLGLNRFNKFKKTIEFIKNGEYESASKEMLNSKWANQVKGRASELSEMMRTGEWQ